MNNLYLETNLGHIPLEEFLDIMSIQYGFDNYADMLSERYDFDSEFKEVYIK